MEKKNFTKEQVNAAVNFIHAYDRLIETFDENYFSSERIAYMQSLDNMIDNSEEKVEPDICNLIDTLGQSMLMELKPLISGVIECSKTDAAKSVWKTINEQENDKDVDYVIIGSSTTSV